MNSTHQLSPSTSHEGPRYYQTGISFIATSHSMPKYKASPSFFFKNSLSGDHFNLQGQRPATKDEVFHARQTSCRRKRGKVPRTKQLFLFFGRKEPKNTRKPKEIFLRHYYVQQVRTRRSVAK